MTRQNKRKLNQLFFDSSYTLFTSEWLNKQGIDRKLAWWYVHSGWLERITDRVYKKTAKNIYWTDVVNAIQQQLQLPLHAGGKSALQLLGKAQYVPLVDVASIDLFVSARTTIPSWVNKKDLWDTKFNLIKKNLFNGDKKTGLITQETNNIEISMPERAILEVFYQVTKTISYQEALQLLENLPFLRPKILQELLNRCTSIKTKRLFMCAAEKFNYEWFGQLNIKKINFGKGKLKIGDGGNYNAKYKLSLPISNQET